MSHRLKSRAEFVALLEGDFRAVNLGGASEQNFNIARARGGAPGAPPTVSFPIEVDGRKYTVSFAGCAQAAATADEVCRKFGLARRECGGVRAEFAVLCAHAANESAESSSSPP